MFAADKTGEETRTVVDATGAEVEVPAHPKRIAVPTHNGSADVEKYNNAEMQRI